MGTGKRRRVFGDKIDFKSLACAPVNELGVVYLFGVLHEALDFKVESIQAGFPDCVARRQVGRGRWEEVRIEFEFESRSFHQHGHDAEMVDAIVCWEHNWTDCPADIEVIEMRSLVVPLETVAEQTKTASGRSRWKQFCREKRLEGLPFVEIARLYKKEFGGEGTRHKEERGG